MRTKITALIAGNLLAVAGAPAAYAQESSLQLDEVIVTAEKREVDLQKTAMSIQVYKGEELQKQGKKRIDEIMSGVVGVQSRDSQVGNVFFVRGVDSGGGGSPAGGSGTTVAVLIDGVYQSRGETVRGGTLDVSQVEVMRGTQSSTLGVGALAGAVSLVTNKPVFEYQGSGSLEVGNYNLVNTEAVLNVPLSDSQAVRIAYSTNKRDGYLSSNAGESDISNARLKYRWRASDNLDLGLTASHQSIGGNGVAQGVLTRSGHWEAYRTGGTYVTTYGYPPMFGLVNDNIIYSDRSDPWDDGYPKDVWPNNPFRDTNIDSYSAEVNWTTGIGTLTVLPSYEHAHFRSAEPPRGSGSGWMGEDRLQKTHQVDVRLASKSGGVLEWLAGAYYYNTDFSGYFLSVAWPNDSMNVAGPTVNNNPCGFASGTAQTCTSWSDTKSSTVTTQALYGDLTFEVLTGLRLKGGARYSRDEKAEQGSTGTYVGGFTQPQYRQLSTGMAASNLVPFTGYQYNPEFSHTWSDVVYSAGVEYDLGASAMVYGAYKTGYQAGALNVMGATPTYTDKNTSEQITLGLKSRFLDNKLQLNVEAFSMSFENRPVGNATGTIFNAGNTADATCVQANPVQSPFVPANYSCLLPGAQFTVDNQSTGVDVEINFLPTAADRIDLSFEWLDSIYSGTPSGPSFTVANLTAAAGVNGGAVNNPAAQALLDTYAAQLNSYDGVTLQNAPKYSGNITYSHKFSFAGGSTFTPSVNMAYKDKYWTQGGAPAPGGFDIRTALADGNFTRQDAYTLWNAYASWASADGRFTVNGYVKNIENKPIQTNIGGEPGSSVLYVSLDAPRTFGVSFGASF